MGLDYGRTRVLSRWTTASLFLEVLLALGTWLDVDDLGSQVMVQYPHYTLQKWAKHLRLTT